MKYTYYGQSCFLLETDGYKLLFDPFIQGNPLAKDVKLADIQADFILVSHGHADHLADLVSIAKSSGAKVIAMPEICEWIGKQGVENVHGMNFGSFTFDFGHLRMVWATHSSGLPDGSYGGNPAGFVLKTASKQIYFAGDTGLTMEMKLIADLYQLDCAILPIGGNYTMDPQDALFASQLINCKKIIGVHYNTFPVIEIDTEAAKELFTQAQKELILPQIGEQVSL
ncbi:MAG: metal-dependent hydrolase [Pedobacter sp.]|nr:MAG: metal-dependent hydrolase [Pedobacter sp.]